MILGFRTGKEQKSRNESWVPFGLDCLDKYSLWTRVRLAVLIVFRYQHIGELDIPWTSGNIEEVKRWVEEFSKNPEIVEAFRIATEAFENDEERD